MKHSPKYFLLTLMLSLSMATSIFAQEEQQLTFEQLQDAIIQQNAECPLSLGPAMEITSMSLNHEYFTLRLTLKQIAGLHAPQLDESNIKEQSESIMASFGKEFLLPMSNQNIGIKYVFSHENGNKVTLIFTPDDIKRILEKPAATPQQLLAITIENNNKSMPIEANGFTALGLKIVADNVVMDYIIDESKVPFVNIKTNHAQIKKDLRAAMIADFQTLYIAALATKCGYGYGYRYVGGQCKEEVNIIFTEDEIMKMEEESPNREYLP